MPAPEGKHGLQRFHGMTNYLKIHTLLKWDNISPPSASASRWGMVWEWFYAMRDKLRWIMDWFCMVRDMHSLTLSRNTFLPQLHQGHPGIQSTKAKRTWNHVLAYSVQWHWKISFQMCSVQCSKAAPDSPWSVTASDIFLCDHSI